MPATLEPRWDEELAHDLLAWKDPNSLALVAALVAAAAMWEAVLLGVVPQVSISLQVMVAGGAVLLACSPAATALLGIFVYAWWRFGPKAPSAWGMHDQYQTQWDSKTR